MCVHMLNPSFMCGQAHVIIVAMPERVYVQTGQWMRSACGWSTQSLGSVLLPTDIADPPAHASHTPVRTSACDH